MKLSNVHIAGHDGLHHIEFANGRISRIESVNSMPPEPRDPSISANEYQLSLNEAIAFPGLINSHDHLDFDLFPRYGSRIYPSYTEWGSDIHQTNKINIAGVLKIPQPLRIRWGIYKNLLNGITTVVHHGAKLKIKEDLISVCQKVPSYHSISGEKRWRLKLVNPFRRRWPLAIHIGEGTSPASSAEIGELIKWNIFNRELIGIHGIAMNEKQASSFHALVWCPDSNLFLYNKTAAIDRIRHHTRIVFGTDSTLTASWNLWEHLRLARDQHLVTDTELWDMLTRSPAELWGLEDCGKIEVGQWADLTVASPPAHTKGWDAVYGLNPENILLVLHKGNIRLFDGSLYDQLARASFPLNDFHKIQVRGITKYIQGDLPGLMNEIRKIHPSVEFPVEQG